MKRLLSITLLLFFWADGLEAQKQPDQCFTCHEALGDKPSTLYVRDVHRAKGISCAGCHGGDPLAEDMDEGMSPQKGFIGVPKGDAISAACEKCHSSTTEMNRFHSSLPVNQGEMLAGSVHGRLAVSGQERMLQCTTCHDAHGVVSVKNRTSPVHPANIVRACGRCHSSASYMRQYNPALPIDQVEKYRTSVHGMLNARGDVKVAECASCHGGHDVRPASDVRSKVYPVNLPAMCGQCHSDAEYMKTYKIPTDQLEKYSRSVHGMALLQKHDLNAPACNDCHGNHGAIPPGVESISKVCGTCHALSSDLFSASPHKKAFDQRKLPECETCHGHHEIDAATEQLLGIAEGSVCSRCHSPTEYPKGFFVAQTMRALVDSLEYAERVAARLVNEAEQKGMEISEAKFKLRDARQARFESRTIVHAFDEAKFREVVERGLSVAGVVSTQAQEAVDEYYFRRWGLGVSTLIISILALSLYLTIKRIEKRQAGLKSNRTAGTL